MQQASPVTRSQVMRTSIFIVVVLLSGCFAGLIQSAANLAIVEPYLDTAIGLENQHLFASGEEKDTPEFWAKYQLYRDWQKGGQFLAGAILGTSIGALFGIVFAYSKNVLPTNNYIKKSLVLAGIMWLTIYLIPFLKYPANPPAVGDPETIVIRQILYVVFIAISGLGAFAFYKISKCFHQRKRLYTLVGYGIFIATVFIVMPSNLDEINAPMNLVSEFRIASALAVTVFWISLGIILGAMWRQFNPDKSIKRTIQ